MAEAEAPKALVLAFSKLKIDPRVQREIMALKEICAMTAAGFSDPEIPGVEFILLELKLPKTYRQRLVSKVSIIWRAVTRRFLQYYWGQPHIQAAQKKLEGKCFDLVVANDIDTLPLALKIAYGAPVLFDAHEYSPQDGEQRLKDRILANPYKYFLCRQFIPRAAAFITVAEGIARQYLKDVGITAKVITNAPAYVDSNPRWVTDDNKYIEMIHHGAAIRGRYLELLIDMMNYLDARYRLTLMLVPTDKAYLRDLESRAAGRRIIFRPPVPFVDIISTLDSYDIGLPVVYPSSFNNLHSLSNKFFEFIQARLVIVAGPSPEMATIINKYGLGVVAQDFTSQSLAASVAGLTVSAINDYKRNSDRAARELSAGCNLRLLQDIAQRLLEQGKQGTGRLAMSWSIRK